MFWSALQSGQAGPIVRQFGLGNEAVGAAATGNLEEFVTALESEAKTTTSQTPQQQQQQQQSQDEKSKKQSSNNQGGSGGNSSDKKDDENNDDDEGMALD